MHKKTWSYFNSAHLHVEPDAIAIGKPEQRNPPEVLMSIPIQFYRDCDAPDISVLWKRLKQLSALPDGTVCSRDC